MITELKSRFYDLPMRKKLLVLLFTCSILPLTLITGYSYFSARNQLLEQAYENMEHMNRQINSNISNQLETWLQISGLLYTNATLKTYLTQEYEKEIDFVEAYDYINDLFYGLMTSNSSISGICVYIENETLPDDGVFIRHLREENTVPAWIDDLLSSHGNAVYSEIHSGQSGEGFFTLGRIMNFGSLNAPYGILVLSVKEKVLYSMIEEESEGKQIYILNEKGNILSTRDKSLLTQNLDALLGQTLPRTNGFQIMEIEGEKSLVVCSSMSRGWKTVSIVPLEELLADARASAARILLIALLSFTLALCLIGLISHSLNTRITNLIRQVERIKKEDFNSQITIRGNDEIGMLAHEINHMTSRLNLLINELYKKEIARRDTELYALQSQINPHFLYNTLSVISSLAIRKGDSETSAIINHLSAFYRTSLNKGKRYISVEDELALTRHYLAIQHMRFGNLFTEQYETEEQLYPCRTLKLILQPFLENAINHAAGSRERPLHITIRLYCQHQRLYFEVEDNGIGIPPERLQKLDSHAPEAGFGIYNVRERIRLAYGSDYGVTLHSQPGLGTKAVICIPL